MKTTTNTIHRLLGSTSLSRPVGHRQMRLPTLDRGSGSEFSGAASGLVSALVLPSLVSGCQGCQGRQGTTTSCRNQLHLTTTPNGPRAIEAEAASHHHIPSGVVDDLSTVARHTTLRLCDPLASPQLAARRQPFVTQAPVTGSAATPNSLPRHIHIDAASGLAT